MKKIKNIKILNHFIILVFGSFYLVDVLLNLKISQDFALISAKTFAENELWRILSYPFTFFTLESALLFLFTILLIFPFFELRFRKPIIFVIFISLILIQGLLFSAFFNENDQILKGTDGISIFIITFFLVNNFNFKKITINKKLFHINAFIFLIAISWAVTIYLHSKFVDFDLLTPSIFSMVYGISSGLILDLGIKIHKLIKVMMNPVKPLISVNSVEELMPAEISKADRKHHKSQTEKNHYYEFDNDYFSEDKLNQILDKINTEGEKSLTDEEINYLKEYSRRL